MRNQKLPALADLLKERQRLKERLSEVENQRRALLDELEEIENQIEDANHPVVSGDQRADEGLTGHQAEHCPGRGAGQGIGRAIARSIGRAVASLEVQGGDDLYAHAQPERLDQNPVRKLSCEVLSDSANRQHSGGAARSKEKANDKNDPFAALKSAFDDFDAPLA